MIARLALLIATLGALGPTPAAASEPRQHDGGVFLRLSAGGGGARTDIEDGVDKLEMEGGVGEFHFAVGGIVARNLAIHATLFGWGVSGPTVTFNGASLGSAGFDLGLSAFGGGITYFFSPVNIYVSGSAGFSRLRVDGPSVDGNSDTGLAIDVTGGKEWWVSDRWALGFALGVGYHKIPENNLAGDWSGTSIALRFSSTFN